ncbi:TMEM165/GDT1 family protein [Tumidithrix elongata RA019]|uniref:GDT1 family protein n=1 Tax=Tumidithrix elongata BACA0141 TaxID=2716417 RepID=A0AAW9PVT7_9CYAN|nr:TMEM165/GDT1 family protein [Tumidithrix elongata RA019]
MTAVKSTIKSEADSENTPEINPKVSFEMNPEVASNHNLKDSSWLKSEYLKITVATFLTVFVAELGDKTQITILMIAAQAKSPIVVFLGAAIALVLTSFLGVIAGKWLHQHLPPKLLNTLAGFSFLCLAVGLVWDAVR